MSVQLDPAGSITRMIRRLATDEQQTLFDLHRRCWPMVVELASRRVGVRLRRVADEEDIAAEAFWGFWQAFHQQRVPRLRNRHDLFALLAHLVACRSATQANREFKVARRGQGRAALESELTPADAREGILSQFSDARLAPEEQIAIDDLYQTFVEGLPDSLREIARLHVGGWSPGEIAERLNCAHRTVTRKIAAVCLCWNDRVQSLLSSP